MAKPLIVLNLAVVNLIANELKFSFVKGRLCYFFFYMFCSAKVPNIHCFQLKCENLLCYSVINHHELTDSWTVGKIQK